MFMYITGAIYIGGAGSVIIGGLYWKRGTTAGAWTAMIVGAVLAVIGLGLLNIVWPYVLPNLKIAYPTWQWLQSLPEDFPLNGMHLTIMTAICAGTSYVVVSLLTKVDPDFEMDKMLHRGKYAIDGEQGKNIKHQRGLKALGWGAHFTRGDKFIYLLYFGYTVLTVSWFIIFTIINLVTDVSDDAWGKWWWFYIWIYGFGLGICTTIWFLWGGFKDLFDMFRTLRTIKRDALDDGSVSGHQNVSDEKP